MTARVQTIPKSQRPVSLPQLEMHIACLLAEAPRLVNELAQITGYNVGTVRRRLDALAAADIIHIERVRTPTGMHILWHDGPAPIPKLTGAAPSQHVVRTYPAIGRRDPLVAALFGQPKPALVLEMEH